MTLATALTGRTVIHGLSACVLTGWLLPPPIAAWAMSLRQPDLYDFAEIPISVLMALEEGCGVPSLKTMRNSVRGKTVCV